MRDEPSTNALHRDAAPSRTTRSRSNTAHGYAERFNPVEEEPEPSPPRMTIPKLPSRSRSPAPDMAGSPGGHTLRPALSRTSTHDSYINSRDDSPARRLTRVPTDSSVISSGRNNLRPVRQQNTFADEYEDDEYAGSGSNHRRDRSPSSPDRSSQGSSNVMSRAASWSQNDGGATSGATPSAKRAPPPPPSRAKKPPPPPPPMKRSALSESTVTRY